jgi:putative transposase
MGRPLRKFRTGYPAHIWHRGNDRQAIFRCEGDFHFYWRCLFETSAKARVSVNSYVFMTNHVHLLVTPAPGGSISEMMHDAEGRYGTYYNRRYGRTGTLWEGRFKSSGVEDDQYLITCHRYIDENPLRAGLVRSPEFYAWSSHRFYALEEANPLITPHPGFISLRPRGAAYRALFDSELDAGELRALREGIRKNRTVGAPASVMGRPRKVVPGTTSSNAPPGAGRKVVPGTTFQGASETPGRVVTGKVVPGTTLLGTSDGAELGAGEVALQQREPR